MQKITFTDLTIDDVLQQAIDFLTENNVQVYKDGVIFDGTNYIYFIIYIP